MEIRLSRVYIIQGWKWFAITKKKKCPNILLTDLSPSKQALFQGCYIWKELYLCMNNFRCIREYHMVTEDPKN